MERKAEGHTSHLKLVEMHQVWFRLGSSSFRKMAGLEAYDRCNEQRLSYRKTEYIDNIFREIPREWQNRITDWAFLNNLFLIAIVLYKTVLKMKHSKTQQQCEH